MQSDEVHEEPLHVRIAKVGVILEQFLGNEMARTFCLATYMVMDTQNKFPFLSQVQRNVVTIDTPWCQAYPW